MTKNEQPANDEISLKELINKSKEWFDFILSKKKFIIMAGLAGSVLGIGYSLYKKPIYTANLTFAIENDKSSGGGGVLSLASQFGISLGGTGGSIFEGSNLIELFASRSMVEKTLLMPITVNGKTMSFAEMYIQNRKWRKSWEENPKFQNIQFLPNTNRINYTRVQDSILGVIYEDIHKNSLVIGKKDKKVDIITMEFSSTNENFSKYFCETLISQIGQFYIKTKSKKARINMEILLRQTDSIRRELNNAITGVAMANDNAFNLNPSLNVRRVPSARRQVDVQANTAILTELVKQTELAKVAVRRETPLIQVVDRPIFPLKKERFGKSKGIILGGLLGGFLGLLIVIFRRKFKEIFG